MVQKPPGRNRPVDVDLPAFLPNFLARLARATRWEGRGQVSFVGETGATKPGSYQGTWCIGDPARFAVNYLFREILSKYDDGKPSKEKEAKTWDRFFEAEQACAETNLRLTRKDPSYFSTSSTGVWSLIESARRKISYVLGDLDLNSVHDHMVFTSGASTRVPRRYGHGAYKFSGIPETTFDNLAFAEAAIRSAPLWEQSLREKGGSLTKIVSGNRVESVPKNYKVNRGIAIEPDLNMYVQKGFGEVIRRKLRKVGLDLSSQLTNQDLALYGSVTGGVATIDLSMASDTVSLELVRHLLPPDWCEALERCRSPRGVLPSGASVWYRKFSSMGNGYTFELETLLFWALSTAVCEAYGVSDRLVAVYGDDIVVPATVAQPLVDLLRFCGFTPNEDKTFISGPFRESCGKHYINGKDVTPFYIKEEPTKLTRLFKLHNQLYRWQQRQLWNDHVDHSELSRLLSWLRSLAPSNWRKPRIPDGMGDGAFIGTFDQCCPKTPADTYVPGKTGDRDGWEGWIVPVIVEVTETAIVVDGELYRRGGCKPILPEKKTVNGKRKRRPFLVPPEELGWLMSRISRDNFHRLDYLKPEERGGISLSPRTRVVKMLVPHFD